MNDPSSNNTMITMFCTIFLVLFPLHKIIGGNFILCKEGWQDDLIVSATTNY